MKNLLLRLSVMLLLVSIISCEKEDLSIKNQIINQENEKIFIDGIEHNFIFKENTLGEISLDKEQDVVLSKFIEENESMSYYYDKKDVLHLFKDSDEMLKFMVNENESLLSQRKQIKTESKSFDVLNFIPSTLELYDGTNYQNLILKTNVGVTSPPYNGGNLVNSVNLPDLSNINTAFNIFTFGDVDEKASSIRIQCSHTGPTIPGQSTAYAILYRNSNYSNYSFGMNVTASFETSEIGISDLGKKKMYRKWFKTRYWGNRISSLKHWIE